MKRIKFKVRSKYRGLESYMYAHKSKEGLYYVTLNAYRKMCRRLCYPVADFDYLILADDKFCHPYVMIVRDKGDYNVLVNLIRPY